MEPYYQPPFNTTFEIAQNIMMKYESDRIDLVKRYVKIA